MNKYVKLNSEALEKYERLGYLRTKKLAAFLADFDLEQLPEVVGILDRRVARTVIIPLDKKANECIKQKAREKLLPSNDLINYIIINYLD